MIKHYILNVNPQANYEWDKCILRNPLTGERHDLTTAIAETINREPGSYLISVNIDVQILEETKIDRSANKTIELSTNKKVTQSSNLLAS